MFPARIKAPCPASDAPYATVFAELRNAIEQCLQDYAIQLSKEEQPLIDPFSEALDAVQNQLTAL
jgi:hypothetical protein